MTAPDAGPGPDGTPHPGPGGTPHPGPGPGPGGTPHPSRDDRPHPGRDATAATSGFAASTRDDAPAGLGDASAPAVDTGGLAGVTVLDCLGKRCPLPVIMLARRLPELPLGAVLRVLADDPAAGNDIRAWCRMRGQEFLAATAAGGAPAFDVRRTA